MSSIFSIYVPRMKSTVNDEYINYVFCQEKIGSIVRVDFTSIGQKPGFKEKTDDVIKSAFVYLFLYNTDESLSFKNKVLEDNGHRIYLNGLEKGYWIVLPNKAPVPFTMMNNAQIVDNCRYLEKQVEAQGQQLKEQSDQLNEQSQTINLLNKKMIGFHSALFEIIGGIYSEETQLVQMNRLWGQIEEGRDKFEISYDYGKESMCKWGFWPTTRQGDHIESKVEELERKIELMSNGYFRHNRLDSDETVSTYSSYSDDNNVLDTDKRRSQISRELCGNE